jgi:hypothetical protein
MYKIERTKYGYMLTFEGNIEIDEIKKWFEEFKSILVLQKGSFGVLIDMRSLKPLSEEAQKVMVQGQQLYKDAGMTRSAMILANAVIQRQFRRLAKDSGAYEWGRYINAADTPNWEQIATNWISKGVDPDKKK